MALEICMYIEASKEEDSASEKFEQMSMTTTSAMSYEKPSSTRICVFQIAESCDIVRVSYLLDHLNCKPRETLIQIRKKYHVHKTLVSVLKRYCNGDFGFDQNAAREGVF